MGTLSGETILVCCMGLIIVLHAAIGRAGTSKFSDSIHVRSTGSPLENARSYGCRS